MFDPQELLQVSAWEICAQQEMFQVNAWKMCATAFQAQLMYGKCRPMQGSE